MKHISVTHVLHGVKTALAAVMAYGLTLWLQLDFGYWAVITAVIVMQIYVADSVELCLYRLSGTTAGALLGIGVLHLIPPAPFAVASALFVTIGVCSFLTRYRTQFRMAAITVAIVVLTGLHAESSLAFGLFRILEIFVGILCAFVVSVLVFPKRRVDVLRSNLISQAETCGSLCLILANAFTHRQRNVSDTLVEELSRETWGNHSLFQKIRQNEALIYYRMFDKGFKAKIKLMNRCVYHLHNMVRTLNALPGNGFEIILSQELSALARAAANTLRAVVADAPDTGADGLAACIQALDNGLINIRRDGRIRRFDSKRLVQIFSFYSSLVYFSQDVLALARVEDNPAGG